MATRKDKTLRPQLLTLFNLGAIRELTDGQLLERFLTDRGEMAELAFAALVERHSAMVMRVCRARLSNPHDAQDAFQATFLILVKKARTLWVQDSLGPWLHQVALRTATCARQDAARRQRLERQAAERAAPVDPQAPALDGERGAMLHDAIDRLPERYRIPIILCDLEGRTCEEAARRMGRPVGTIKSWRARGRERLRERLIQVGLAPSATLEATLAADLARGAVPKPEAETVRAATRIRGNAKTTGDVPASVCLLIKGVMKAMLLSKLRTTATILCALALFAAGLGTVARVAADDAKDKSVEPLNKVPPLVSILMPDPTAPRPEEREIEVWELTLRDAIRIGLKGSDGLRLVKAAHDGGPDASDEIVPLATDLDPSQFKTRVMRYVHSVTQQYWNLTQQHVQLWSSEKAVELAREVKSREEAELELGRGTVADVAEIRQRLEQFQLDLITKKSDLIAAEQSLREHIGLPLADTRRIVPVTPPTEKKVPPDWKTSHATMLEQQPDVAQTKAMVVKAEKQFLAGELEQINKAFAEAPGNPGEPAPAPDATRHRLNRYHLIKKKAYLQQVIHQTTQSLSRFFLEVDANFKQYQTASRLRTAATQRLEAQRAFYEQGRITVDRYLDAISQYASAVAQEAQFKTTYNIGLTSLEEAQGTLLEYEKLTVSQRPSEAKTPSTNKHDDATVPATHEHQALVTPMDRFIGRRPHPTTTSTVPIASQSSTGEPASVSLSFEKTIAFGSKPITIQGSFTIKPAPSTSSAPSKAP
ncbi:RNA polymerase sigma factor, sigma-70 family [Singulisphaera sp. GP187]|uniref:sigma-70 family RNA polymerase sigma factor n=1 Tax=Singulisphaera sp. GP187 TaxID=1882752 RepID=UPI00092AAE42|nr:sigma-70 family RNA polymerase sigma factor [Singulisphaera sp. GP187]SIO29090.1 RNA polymerase sigma factor, sigma-70 family [Singulisphaera sp. GP187]